MNFKGIEICCPQCGGELFEDGVKKKVLGCRHCNKNYPVIFGIPDLRIFPDPYIGLEEDREKGLRVAERFDDFDFPGLIDYYYSMTPKVPTKHAQQFKNGVLAAQARAKANLTAWRNDIELNGQLKKGNLLEIGCGTAPLLVAGASMFGQLIGIDISFRWLVVAKKRLSEKGLDIPLICSCAEALPFPDSLFDFLAAESVIENVRDQDRTLHECHRVMRPAGHLFISSPNRFSLGPDPHTGIWAGGYLPDRWTAALVRKQGGIPPKRKLLSARSLKSKIQMAGFKVSNVKLPLVPKKQRNHYPVTIRILISFYDVLRKLPLSRQLLLIIGPLLNAIALKPARNN